MMKAVLAFLGGMVVLFGCGAAATDSRSVHPGGVDPLTSSEWEWFERFLHETTGCGCHFPVIIHDNEPPVWEELEVWKKSDRRLFDVVKNHIRRGRVRDISDHEIFRFIRGIRETEERSRGSIVQ